VSAVQLLEMALAFLAGALGTAMVMLRSSARIAGIMLKIALEEINAEDVAKRRA
jgi:hypothetical protein